MGGTCCYQRETFCTDRPITPPAIKLVWYFDNGTIIHGPCTKNECRDKMMAATEHRDTFYASEIASGVYEVQFSNDVNPDVVVIVRAPTGFDAGIAAHRMLALDYAYFNTVYHT